MDTLLRLTEEPPSCDTFSSKKLTHDPVVLYGCKIRTKYDQQRIQFKSKFTPVSMKTRCHLGDNHYFRGIRLMPMSRKLNRLIRIMNRLPHDNPDVFNMYKKRLQLCGLTCENNWSHLASNVFPIDVDCVDEIADSRDIVSLSDVELLDMINTGLAWHSHYVHFNIYILT